MDTWLDQNPAVVQQTAAQLLSRAFFVDVPVEVAWYADKPALLSIRLRLGASSAPPATLSPSFAGVLERVHGDKEDLELPRANHVNVDHWQLSFTCPKPGFYRCHVLVTLERGGPRFRVGGSPFLVAVQDEGACVWCAHNLL